MLISINPADPRPIYIQIVDEVRRALVLGLAEPDSSLPSVRQLATELRVNPNTVGQAYRELENQGLAYTKRGQGTFVASVKVNDGERRALADAVAERALRDAYHNGLNADDLISAIRNSVKQHPNVRKQNG